MTKLRFAAIGINHAHIYGQVDCLLRAGAELVGFHAPEDDLAKAFAEKYPQAPRVAERARLLEDKTIALILSSGIPADRAPLGIEVMRHGKDYMSDKPGMTSLEQLAEVRRVQAETRRIYSVCYSEHFETRSTVKAGELIAAGAIGKVINTVGLGPHKLKNLPRPDWFYSARAHRRRPDRHRLASMRTVPVFRRRARCQGGQRDGRQPRQSGPAGIAGFRRDAAARPAMSPATSASTGSRPTACRTGATAG